jgi:hypothetical protein
MQASVAPEDLDCDLYGIPSKHQLRHGDPRWPWAHFGAAATGRACGLTGRFTAPSAAGGTGLRAGWASAFDPERIAERYWEVVHADRPWQAEFRFTGE